MGNLLGAPITEKETHVGSTNEFKYGLSSMQGWRVHMEDAHIAETSLYYYKDGGDDSSNNQIPVLNHSLFAVFDGHGGNFAAIYSGKNFCRVFSKQPKWIDYAKQLQSPPISDNNNDNNNDDKAKQVEWTRTLLETLEQAFQDAFLELDQEIAFAVQRNPHDDANTPYHQDDVNTTTTTTTTATKTTPSQEDVVMKAASDHVKALNEQEGDHTNRTDSSSSSFGDPKHDYIDDPGAGADFSGTTACIVLITPDHFVCANAGDSRSVCSKNKNRVFPLSYDHKPDDEEEERRIRAGGGYVAGGRVEGDLAVSRGLGDLRFKHLPTVLAGKEYKNGNQDLVTPQEQKVSPVPDVIVQSRNRQQDEFIILACDGIWDVRSNQECADEVASLFQEGEDNLGLICEEVLDRCLTLGSKDNMTALVVQFPAQKVDTVGDGVTGRRELRERIYNDQEQQQQEGAEDNDNDDDRS